MSMSFLQRVKLDSDETGGISFMNILGMIELISSLILLVYLTMKGINIIISAIIASIVIAVTSGLNLGTALMDDYMTGFTNYLSSWFLVFLLGAIFGKIMQGTKSDESIANWIKRTLGTKRAVFAVVAAAGIMTYGGVSLFVVGFVVYPIARSLFRAANFPHRFIPAALVFGSISFTMTAPGFPEIQNIIPIKFFGTSPIAGGHIGVLSALLIMVAGGLLLGRMVRKAVEKGETFSLPNASLQRNDELASSLAEEDQESQHLEKAKDLPNIILSFLPLIVVIALLNILSVFINPTASLLIALTTGIFLASVLMKNILGILGSTCNRYAKLTDCTCKYVRSCWLWKCCSTSNSLR